MGSFSDSFQSLLPIIEDRIKNLPVKGFIASSKFEDIIFPLGSDTKVLGTVFELLSRKEVYEVANKEKLLIKEASRQNFYPDFTIMRSETDLEKIALDIKTTYISKKNQKFKFTLGSYTSFLRNPTKNIEYNYKEYKEHWVLGFVYQRDTSKISASHIWHPYEKRERIKPAYSNVDLFFRQKWEIASDSAGSGNTANIGSIYGEISDFKNKLPLFKSEKEFEAYWRGYKRTALERETNYRNIKDFRQKYDH